MIEKHAGSVIVVDDEPNVLMFTSLLLKKKGYSASACGSAREALEVLQKNNIDVVLTDIMMPEMSGIELLEEIHSIDPDIPVILVTGFADLDKAIEAIKKGAFDFITKPYDNTYLTHSIEKAVRYHRLIKMEAGYREILEELNAEVETLITERTMGLMALTVADRVRNPATTIAWTCKRILEKEDAPERMKEDLNIILSEAVRLEAIVKDFQELFKTRGASFKHGEIKGVVEDVISVAEKEALYKGIDLTVHISEKPLRMNMESNILRMALIHLVRNAIEATPTGGSVIIKTYEDNEKVVVEVSDTGQGIPKDEIDKIFEPFFSTKKHRFGMGLSLVKQIVSEHLGEIEVESEMGKGTTFRLIFPVRWMERLT
jgi:signal transduction histidine kinase